MSELLPPDVLVAVLPYLIPHLAFGILALWPRVPPIVVRAAFVALVAAAAAFGFFVTHWRASRIPAALTAAEVYGLGLALVWAGVALWRRKAEPVVLWRLAAVLVWAVVLPAFPITGLMLGCMNDNYACP